MNLSWKKLVIGVIIFLHVGCSPKKGEKPVVVKEKAKMEILVGTYTNKTSQGIYKLAFNQVDGTVINQGLIAEIENPSYLTSSKDKKYVYAAAENEIGKISSFKWNKDRTELKLINKLPTEGIHPCFVELNTTENLVAVANYSSGNMAVFRRNSDGSLQKSPQLRQHKGHGTLISRQEKPHAHCAKFYKDKFVYVVDLGIDEVASYSVDSRGELGQKHIALKTDDGDGPRHLIFHPTKNISYIINELSSSIIISEVNQENGEFSRIQKESTLPLDFVGESFCADIHMTSDGKFLYASNRGHNSIAVFSVDKKGKLTPIRHESVRGEWPRNFTLSPNEKFLLVANQHTDNIVVFERDSETGLLTFTGNEIIISKPICLKF